MQGCCITSEIKRFVSSVSENSYNELIEICSIIEQNSSTLSQIIDAVAALSCESLKADVKSFRSVDKDAIAVANDLKVLLNGSKLIGEKQEESVSKIPRIHGKFRSVVKSLRADVRVLQGENFDSGSSEVLRVNLLALLVVIKNIGECCFDRAKLCFESIVSGELRNGLSSLFEKCSLEYDSLKNGFSLAQCCDEDYCKFGRFVNESLGIVYRIVGWEAVCAFFKLKGGELFAETTNKKEEKAVLGKGTRILVQFINDRLLAEEDRDRAAKLKQWVEKVLSLLNPEDPGFACLLEKVMEVVESTENRRLPKLPKGTSDFANEQMIFREKAFPVIQNVFKRHGATALDTPVFELRETLKGNYGEDSKLIFDLEDQGGELYSLRYDLTVPFARYVAMNKLSSFKRYQIAKVYRRDTPSKGRFREFYQCDFDNAVDSDRMGPDAEVVKIMTELLDELQIGDYEIKLSHRKLLDGIMEICGVPSEKFRTICSSIDKLDKQSFEQVKKEMVEEKGLSSEIADRIGTFVKESGKPIELLSKLRQEGSELLSNESSRSALEDLGILFDLLTRLKCISRIVFDLSLARGLDYYTDFVFEAVCIGAKVGSIGAGGRYDNLIAKFGGKQVPAVGLSLGIERVFTRLEELQKEQKQEMRPTETQVLVSVMVNNKLAEALEITNELWEAKIKAEYLVNKRQDKHSTYVKESGIPWMVIVGKKELETNTVTLKKTVKEEDEVKGVKKKIVKGKQELKLEEAEVKEVKEKFELNEVPRESFVAKLLELFKTWD